MRSRRVALAGVAVARNTDGEDTPHALLARAARTAVADAGLRNTDVDGFGSTSLGTMPPIEVAEYLGLRPRWVESTAIGGSSWEVTAAHAADAIVQHRADVVVLAYGSTARSDLRKGCGPRTSTGARAGRCTAPLLLGAVRAWVGGGWPTARAWAGSRLSGICWSLRCSRSTG